MTHAVPHPSVAERLARLAPDQRAAATAPPGPVLCVAPAGSGKTTTLVARVAWLVDGGADPGSVCIVAFNKRAAEELTARLDAALVPLDVAAGSVRVRTFHALGREILRDAGVAVEPLADRDAVLRDLFPGITRADRGRLDLAFSRLKLDLRVTADEVARDPTPGPVARAFIAYEGAVRDSGGLDFDDLLVRALERLQADARLLARWRSRTARLLVDEAQDLDRTQLELALLLAAPANDIFLVGDDDQTVYSWRLADVRRVLGLAASLPGLRRVDLETNYRCPPPVVARAVRLVEHNRERFAKRILAGSRVGRTPRPRPRCRRRCRASPAGDGLVAGGRHDPRGARPDEPRAAGRGGRRARPRDPVPRARPPARHRGSAPGRAAGQGGGRGVAPAPARPGRRIVVPSPPSAGFGRRCAPRRRSSPPDDADEVTEGDLVTALLGWAAGHPSIAALRAAVTERRARLAELRRDDAALTLATAHGTKGLEWDHVLVLADGFPGRRAIGDATEPERALEEERRLAYVAWTRARRSLTLLYDPEAPSPFLGEAFDPDELAPPNRDRAA